MPTAIVTVKLIEIVCPKCGEGVESREGYTWAIGIDPIPAKFPCPHCGVTLVIPRKYTDQTRNA